MKPAPSFNPSQMLFANTKAFWLSMFDAFFHSAVELIETAHVKYLIRNFIMFRPLRTPKEQLRTVRLQASCF